MKLETEEKTTTFSVINPRMLPLGVISSAENENSLEKNEGRYGFSSVFS